MHRRVLVVAASLAWIAASAALADSLDEAARSNPAAQEEAVTRIQLIVGDQSLPATLDDTPAARDFAALLPLDLEVRDFNATEKVADLPRRLDTRGAPSAYAAQAGDLTYYAPWGNLAIFYRDFRSAGGLVRLGRIDGSLDPLLRSGEVRVRVVVAGASD